MTETEAWRIERDLWLSEPEIYDQRLAPEAIIVLPGTAGILTSAATIDASHHFPRLDHVAFESMRMIRPAPNLLLLAYEASGVREGGTRTYRARCSSMYVDQAGEWFLAFHQQTPLGSTSSGSNCSSGAHEAKVWILLTKETGLPKE
jgi:hypothetical protein